MVSMMRPVAKDGTAGEDLMALVVVLLILLYLLASVRILRQYERGVVFLLGRFAGVRGPGLTLIFIPILQMVRVSLRTVTMQIPVAEDHYPRQRLDRYRGGRLLSRHRPGKVRDRHRERLQCDQSDQSDNGAKRGRTFQP